MRYFKKEDFNKFMEFLADKPDTVETQQELYKFMHGECHKVFAWNKITVKNMCIYSRIYKTSMMPDVANWSATMSDGSQVVWNKKYLEFYMIDGAGIDQCDYRKYIDLFPELIDVDKWLLENWSNWRFKETQKQLIAIWNGKYDEDFTNLLR